jgi:hypothetical protein
MGGADAPPTIRPGGIRMTTAIRVAVFCLFLVSFVSVASTQEKSANVAGKWDVTVIMPDHNVSEQWMIEQTGSKLTGTAKGPDGELPITGEINGINFRSYLKKGDTDIKVVATVNGDTIDGAVTIGAHGSKDEKEYLWSAKRPKP